MEKSRFNNKGLGGLCEDQYNAIYRVEREMINAGQVKCSFHNCQKKVLLGLNVCSTHNEVQPALDRETMLPDEVMDKSLEMVSQIEAMTEVDDGNGKKKRRFYHVGMTNNIVRRSNEQRKKSGCEKFVVLCEAKDLQEARRLEANTIHLCQFHDDKEMRAKLTNLSSGGGAPLGVVGVKYFIYALIQDPSQPEQLPAIGDPEKFVKQVSDLSRADFYDIHDGVLDNLSKKVGNKHHGVGFTRKHAERTASHNGAGLYDKVELKNRDNNVLLRAGQVVKMKDGRKITLKEKDILYLEIIHHDRLLMDMQHIEPKSVTKLGGNGFCSHADLAENEGTAVLYVRTMSEEKHLSELAKNKRNQQATNEKPKQLTVEKSSHIPLNVVANGAGLQLKAEKPFGNFRCAVNIFMVIYSFPLLIFRGFLSFLFCGIKKGCSTHA
jgi:hypothetical protein